MKTERAQAAKEIRKIVKDMGIKASVRSRSGSSVVIYVTNATNETVQNIKDATSKFKYGYFDGTTDCYVMSNNNDNVPQVRFIFVENEIEDAILGSAWDRVVNSGKFVTGLSSPMSCMDYELRQDEIEKILEEIDQ